MVRGHVARSEHGGEPAKIIDHRLDETELERRAQELEMVTEVLATGVAAPFPKLGVRAAVIAVKSLGDRVDRRGTYFLKATQAIGAERRRVDVREFAPDIIRRTR